MRDGHQPGLAPPGEWLAAVRGLGGNAVRAYLLAARRRRKTPFWLRPDLPGFVLGAYVLGLLVLFALDCATAPPGLPRLAYAWSTLALTYQITSLWAIGIPLLGWWSQGLVLWANDALCLFSFERGQACALPVELALIPERDTAFVCGALSVLLPPLLVRVLGVLLCCYIALPWPLLRLGLSLDDSLSWPELSSYVSWRFPTGVLVLLAFSALSATVLSCMLLCASHRWRHHGMRSAVVHSLPFVQFGGLLYASGAYCDGYSQPVELSAGPLLGIALAGMVLALALAALGLLLALHESRLKSTLAVFVVALPLAAGALGQTVAALTIEDSVYIAPELTRAWCGGSFLLVNPVAIPDPALLLERARWWYPENYEAQMLAELQQLTALGVSLPSTEIKPWPRPGHWLVSSALQLLLLLSLLGLSLEAARLNVSHWRQAG